jgi:hypothetical protein
MVDLPSNNRARLTAIAPQGRGSVCPGRQVVELGPQETGHLVQLAPPVSISASLAPSNWRCSSFTVLSVVGGQLRRPTGRERS